MENHLKNHNHHHPSQHIQWHKIHPRSPPNVQALSSSDFLFCSSPSSPLFSNLTQGLLTIIWNLAKAFQWGLCPQPLTTTPNPSSTMREWLTYWNGPVGKESTRNAGDTSSIPGLGRSAGEGNSYPLQYSTLKKSMDCKVHGITNSRTCLNNFHFTHFSKRCLIWREVGPSLLPHVLSLLGNNKTVASTM